MSLKFIVQLSEVSKVEGYKVMVASLPGLLGYKNTVGGSHGSRTE